MFHIDNLVDEAVIINMNKDLEKYQLARGQLKQIFNGKINRLVATDGSSLKAHQLNLLVNYYYNLTLMQQDRSIIGCSLSHQRAWLRCIRNNYRYILVCEDDIQVVNKYALENALQQIQNSTHLQSFDILYLGCFGLCKPPQNYYWWDKLISLGLYVSGFKSSAQQIHENIFVPQAPGGGHCYIISNYGCHKLLSYFQRDKITNHVDLQINQYRDKLNMLAVTPIVVTQDYSSSNLTDKHPRLINYITKNHKVIGEQDMPINWLWSQKIFGISGWLRLFMILVLLFGWRVYLIIIAIYTYDLMSGDYREFIVTFIILTTVLLIRKIISTTYIAL